MTMQSLALLPELRKLPTADESVVLDHDETVAHIRTMDRGHFAIEVSQATEEVLQALFEWRNIPDHLVRDLREAYRLSFSSFAEQGGSVHEHYSKMLTLGSDSVKGFVSNLKGKVAELQTVSQLNEQNTESLYRLAESPTQPVYDIIRAGPDGEQSSIQVKARGEEYAGQVVDDIEEHPNIAFYVSSEIYGRIAEKHPELLGRVTDIGPVAELTEFVTDGLDTLAENSGVDVPDSLGEALPFVAEVVLSLKLIWGIVSTEREMADVDLTDRARVHGIRTLALASRFGINQVCMWAGGAGGTLAGTVVPGAGNLAGGLGGGLAGIGGGMTLNKLLQPRIEEVAMNLIGGDADDMFYLMNKVEIDRIGESLVATQAA